jgi:hypothetical protein
VKKFAFFLSLSLFLPAAWADPICDGHNVRLDSPGQPLEGLPVLDQAEWGHCYAFASAAVYDALRFNLYSPEEKAIEKGTFIDPVALASFKASYDDQSRLRDDLYQTEAGGDISDKFDRTAYQSLCELTKPSDVNRPLDQFLSTSEGTGTNRKYFEFLAIESKKIFEEKKHYANLSDFYNSEYQKIQTEITQEAKNDHIEMRLNRQFNEFVKNFYNFSLDTPDGVKAIHETLYGSCKKSIPIKVSGKISFQTWDQTGGSAKDFDSLFTRAFCGAGNGINKPMPVLIDIPEEALKKEELFRNFVYHAGSDASNHMVAAIGMQTASDGTREILVRNSAGDCRKHEYISEIHCDQSKRAFWMKESDLLKITDEARSIQIK